MKILSIITVTYNAATPLQKTLQSLKEQEVDDQVEYLIIDGNSKDGTMEVVRQNKKWVTDFISEPDKGLYDAMNKGMEMASGAYIWFMNAGDTFFDNTTVSKVLRLLQDQKPDVLFGETEVFSNQGYSGMRRLSAPEKLTWNSFQMGMLVCHQSIIIKKALASPYDVRYQLAADIDWVISALKKSDKILNSKLILSRFETGGVSGQRRKQGLFERFEIMKKHYGLATTVFNHIKIAFRLAFHLALGKKI